MARFFIGVDEAGRGPLAGPMAVGLIYAPARFDIRKNFPGVNDSKQLSVGKREEIYEMLLIRRAQGDINFCVRFSSHDYIDEHGLTKAARRSIYNGVRYLSPEPKGVKIFLDGLLHAPVEYNQQTIIKGDQLVPIISLASIAAKVERDRLMLRLAKKYPNYGFEVHKGYGTKKHLSAIKQWGLCDIHRRSFSALTPA